MEAKKPEKLDKLLRCSMISMLMEIRPGLKEATGGSGTAGAAENSGVDRLGGLLGVPQVGETLYLDQARKPVPQATFIEQLDKAMELVIRPENMPRFQFLRGLTPGQQGLASAAAHGG